MKIIYSDICKVTGLTRLEFTAVKRERLKTSSTGNDYVIPPLWTPKSNDSHTYTKRGRDGYHCLCEFDLFSLYLLNILSDKKTGFVRCFLDFISKDFFDFGKIKSLGWNEDENEGYTLFSHSLSVENKKYKMHCTFSLYNNDGNNNQLHYGTNREKFYPLKIECPEPTSSVLILFIDISKHYQIFKERLSLITEIK